MKYLILLFIAALTTGCATSDAAYYHALEARFKAEGERHRAIAKIGSGANVSDVAKVASVMALQEHGGSSQVQIAPPRSAMDSILQAVGILAPALVQAYGIRANTQLGMAQSNNAARVAESTNSTFLGMASHIQAPMAPAANVSTVTTNTDSRVTDNSSRVRTDNSQRTADSGNTTTSTTSTWGANSGANSGNSGRIAGTSMVDSATVVTQPPPVVVQPPAPVVVYPQVVNPVVVQ